MPKKYKYYYCDERNDDFANTNIKTIITPRDYKYFNKNLIYRFFSSLVYFLMLIICKIILIFKGVKIKNKKVLRDLNNKKKGYFLYGNHTSYFEDTVSGQLCLFPKKAYIVCNPDALSIKGIRWLVKMLGAYPIPTYKESYTNFVRYMKLMIEKNNIFIIYPEAHIWPYYNKIRDFSDSSFFYPVKFDVPSFAKTTIYRKTKHNKYKMEIYIDGPFYPDKSLSFNDAKKKLCEDIKTAMIKRIQKHLSELNENYCYIKVDSKDKVKIEKLLK